MITTAAEAVNFGCVARTMSDRILYGNFFQTTPAQCVIIYDTPHATSAFPKADNFTGFIETQGN